MSKKIKSGIQLARAVNISSATGGQPAKKWLVRRYADGASGAHLLGLSFPTFGGGRGKLLLPMSTTAAPREIVKALIDRGADWPNDAAQQERSIGQIISAVPDQACVLSGTSGWVDDVFMFGKLAIGAHKGAYRVHEHLIRGTERLAKKAKTSDTWKRSVAKSAAKSSYAAFTIMQALAAPLLIFADLPEGAIFHFGGSGSTGKTTALMAGASVYGAAHPLPGWQAGERGLHERAAANSDLQLILDDTEKLPVTSRNRYQEIASIAHTLTSGESRDYAQSVQKTLPKLQWRCWAVSSGPNIMEREFAGASHNWSDGDRARWIDIPVPSKNEGGVWDRVPAKESFKARGKRSNDLFRRTNRAYGAIGRQWIRLVQEKRQDFAVNLPREIDRFVDRVCPTGGGVERRIAAKFGLVYAAGRLATRQGLLPWSGNLPLKICMRLYLRCMAINGGMERALDAAKAQLLTAIKDGDRFPIATDARPALPNNFEGYRRLKSGGTELVITQAAFRSITGSSATGLLREFQADVVLESGHGKRSAKQVRVNIDGRTSKHRMLVFSYDRLLTALGEDRQEGIPN
ncbi:DUF927 domain-containing protein [Mesorhizobium sp.]|uniref:DUF927 domain-containing protein n=1 Tax=Mesorhizobium sp. TaxID=1871066 RepID=UPI0012222610|nr:DUF927 domain-containing protein [Mesorhizobium sp.]TIL35965.1 MAG: DUF927 domain-containing protein [Mesorhizobium sp.]